MQDYYILGIETTCDETSAAVLKNGTEIVSNTVYSQIDIHKKYSGVVPELASRAHASKIAAVIKDALENIKPDYIAFANGPGLPGGLLVGRIAAETLGMLFDVPVIGVNHLEGHLYACEFCENGRFEPLKFPLISLIVSGGHTELWLVKGYGSYKLLGRTRDDAAGEAFDKVAKLLELGYPGGPEVSAQALKGAASAVRFPRPYMPGNFEFSFSGIKTAVSYYLRDNKNISVAGVCAGFEKAVVDTLVRKTMEAAKKYKIKNLAVGGGVAANTALREGIACAAACAGIKARFVMPSLSSDNAAMIALCAAKKIQYGGNLKNNISIKPDMILRSWA
jgi:N6-L-threonylcarbamoyladenine synthase